MAKSASVLDINIEAATQKGNVLGIYRKSMHYVFEPWPLGQPLTMNKCFFKYVPILASFIYFCPSHDKFDYK